MSPGLLTRALYPYPYPYPKTESETGAQPQAQLPHPQEPGPVSPPRKTPKKSSIQKSIRNAKDSAEMARIKHQRKWGRSPSPNAQSAQSALSGSTAHYGPPQTSPLTPPKTSETQRAGPYWHDGLHESAAALACYPSGPAMMLPKGSFDSARLIPEQAHYPSGEQANPHGFVLYKMRAPSFESSRPTMDRHPDSTSERPQTAGDIDNALLQIPIPHYRLGTPQFSERGTAFLHNSFHTAFSSTYDLSSFSSSKDSLHALFPNPPGQRAIGRSPLRRSPISWFSPSNPPPLEDIRSMPLPGGMLSDQGITSAVYDKIAANPDNLAWVRYAESGGIVAATPARLIVEITSVKFLNYDLLSDFFLTYRSFMLPPDLLRYLIARLRWAIDQTDESGRVVRVRTFVALRHWVLNYFADDFEPDYHLRRLFCDLVNEIFLEVQNRSDGTIGDLQILNELKKCWKRTCELTWDSDQGTEHDSLHSNGRICATTSSDSGVGMSSSLPPPPAHESIPTQENNTVSPWGQSYFNHDRQNAPVPESPFSDTSVHVTSCSIPLRKRSRPNFKSEKHGGEKSIQRSPELSRKPRRKPSQTQQRSGSFSDALRYDRAPAANVQPELPTVQVSLELTSPGSLVRGTILPPNVATVVVPGPLSPLSPPYQSNHKNDPTANSLLHPEMHSSNPAVLKLFDGVRRALSTRHGSKPSVSRGHKHSGSGDMRTVRHTQVRGKSPHPAQELSRLEQPRSDTLSAIAARSWGQQSPDVIPGIATVLAGVGQAGPAVDILASPTMIVARDRPLGPARFNSHVTTSSRSILIVDDTGVAPTTAVADTATQATSGPLTKYDGTDTALQGSVISKGMAANNSAYCFPDAHSTSTTNRGNGHLTSSTLMDIVSPPLSPPHTVPLPPIPVENGGQYVLHDSEAEIPSPQSAKYDLQEDTLLPHDRSTPISEIGLAIGTPPRRLGEEKDTNEPTSPTIDASDAESSQPRQLRRRPGGNLRAVDNVQDLGFIRRRQSTGSLYTQVFSSPTSTITSSECGGPQIAARLSRAQLMGQPIDSQLRESMRRSSMRLLSTHSSQPNLRPSFEFEVKRLAALPADDEDGDVEATLLKLEGKFRPVSQSATTETLSSDGSGFPSLTRQNLQIHATVQPDQVLVSVEDHAYGGPQTPITETQGASIYNISHASHETMIHQPEVLGAPEEVPAISQESDRQSKKLRRGSRILWSTELPPGPQLQHAHIRSKSTMERKDPAKVFSSSISRAHHIRGNSESASASHTKPTFLLDDNESFVDAASMRRMKNTAPTGHSFFLDEEEEEEEGEGEGEEEEEEEEEGDEGAAGSASTQFPMLPNNRPPSPPTTVGASSGRASFGPPLSLLSPGPELIPSAPFSRDHDPKKQTNLTTRKQRKGPPPRLNLQPQITPHHTPFILAYSSSVLAGQFTLIEKDALDSIDWKDLVNLSWSQTPATVRDWARYTHSLDCPSNVNSSIDLIIARFNLVIKWCISSVLLCATPAERATCIAKSIHVASYAYKKLHNFATAAQITIGLLSLDLAKLTSTWALVPQAEKDMLISLEKLISPVRNFAALRAEMESAASTLDDQSVGEDKGVIPFLGVYTRDLVLNAQKPAFMPSESGSGERLVNFERHRTAASIVKGVLRLLDASTRYAIKPQSEVLSRCLWLAALGDDEISSLSKGLD